MAHTMSDPQASLPQPPPPLNLTKFTNRVAIITGAASGVGRQTAIFFARQDAQVILFDINEAGLLEAQHLITTPGGKAAFRKCDITKEGEVQSSIDCTVQELERVNILVNLAGIYEFQPLTSFSTELYLRHMEINVHDPKPGLSAYVTSKAAVLGLAALQRMKSVDGFDAIQNNVLGNQAVKRQGTPMDVANLIGFVAGEGGGVYVWAGI
ncbi:hypothetical protein BDW69DRAFT_182192 [Aspergillus filifer]